MEVDFDKIFAISLSASKLPGCNPYTPLNKKWLASFIIKHGCFTAVFSIVLYNIYLNVSQGNFSEACSNGTVCVVYCVVTYQYAILVVNRKSIIKIIDLIKADFKKEMSEDSRKIVYDYSRKGRLVCIQWLLVTTSTIFIFLGKHVILELYTYVVDEWKFLPLYPLIYPGVIEEYKEQPVVYIILYVLLAFYEIYAGCMYVAFVPLGLTFMIHATGQLEIVKQKALELYNGQSAVEVDIRVKNIVQQIQYIYGFVGHINDIFKLVYEITLKATIIILPITMYEVIGSFQRGDLKLDYVNVIIGGLLISGGPCYYSDKLMEKGDEVRLAIYFCGWETRYDHAVRKTLLMTLMRTQQPIAIRTVFRTVCLVAFTDILHHSYALLNLMNAAWG